MKLIVIIDYSILIFFFNFQKNIIIKIPQFSIYIFHNKSINKFAKSNYRQIFRIFINDKIKS